MSNADNEMNSLFEGLEARRTPPEAARMRAFEAAREVFVEQRARRRQRQRRLLAVAAALIFATFTGVLIQQQPEAFSVEIADAGLLTVNGVTVQQGMRIEIVPGTSMHADQPARLALGRATDLRLNAQTSVRWLSDTSLELEQGAVFVDTGDLDEMTVNTLRGTVRDIGTQFLVALEGEVLEVAVRSGKTIIDSDLGVYEASADGYAGDVVVLSRSEAVSRSEPTSAGRWEWIHSVPRGYDDTRVSRLLEQIARDMGMRLKYVDDGTQAWVMNLQLRGEAIDRLPPARALDVIASTSGLVVTPATGQILTVSRQ